VEIKADSHSDYFDQNAKKLGKKQNLHLRLREVDLVADKRGVLCKNTRHITGQPQE
jgi:hypothetical protein